MSDFNSSLPVRTEQDGDVVVKVGDGTVPSQQLAVNPDGSVNVTDNGGSITVDGTVELGATTLAALESITVQNGAGASAVNIQDGGNSITVDATNLDVRDLAFATDKVDVSGSSVTAVVSATDLDIRDLAFATDKVDVSGSAVTAVVTATDLDIRNLSHSQDSVKVGDGTDFLAVNTDGSINVVIQEDVGVETVNYNTGAAVAAASTSNHDLVFASASKLNQIIASASGKLKIEIQVETGSATGVFNTKAVGFNSTANPNINFVFEKYVAIPAGARVRVIRSNLDFQAQDLYSTIVGILG